MIIGSFFLKHKKIYIILSVMSEETIVQDSQVETLGGDLEEENTL